MSALLTSIFFCLFPLQAVFALITPEVYLRDLKIAGTVFSSGGLISGSVKVWNFENFLQGDLNLAYSITKKDERTVRLFDYLKGDTITLGAKENRTLNFSYWLPYKLPAGNYSFTFGLINPKGNDVAWISHDITVNSSENFFLLDNSDYFKPGFGNLSQAGIIERSEQQHLRFTVLPREDISATTTIAVVYKVVTTRNDGKIYKEEEIPIDAKLKDSHFFDYTMPLLRESGQYTTQVRLYNRGSGDPISNILRYFWIVKGDEGNAAVLYASLDKSSYLINETARVKIDYAIPYWKDPTDEILELIIKFFNESEQIVGETSEEISIFDDSLIVAVPLANSVSNPKVLIELKKNLQTLDSYQFIAKSDLEKKTSSIPVAEQVTQNNNPIFLLLRVKTLSFLGIFLVSVLIMTVTTLFYYLKHIRPENLKKQGKETSEKKESLEDLIKEFEEIDKKNKSFKL